MCAAFVLQEAAATMPPSHSSEKGCQIVRIRATHDIILFFNHEPLFFTDSESYGKIKCKEGGKT